MNNNCSEINDTSQLLWYCLDKLIDQCNRAVVILAYSLPVYKTIERLIQGQRRDKLACSVLKIVARLMNIRMIHQVRIMTASFLAAATLLFSILPTVVVGHGYLKSPRSRNYDAHLTQQWEEYCHHCLNRKPATGTCGTSPTFGRNYDQYTSGVKATYTRGQIIDIEVDLTAHHWGHFVIKACPIVTPTPTQTVTQECFNQNPLRFISGENATFDPDYPDRAYLPPPNPPNAPNGAHPQWDCCGGVWNYKYKFQLPPSVTGDLVLLQWHYITANSCLAPGYNTYNWPVGWDPSYLYGGLTPSCVSIPTDGSVESGKRPEQFWNCAEVRITDSGGGGVSPPPPPTPPPSPPIPKLPPTPPPIGTLGYCNW